MARIHWVTLIIEEAYHVLMRASFNKLLIANQPTIIMDIMGMLLL